MDAKNGFDETTRDRGTRHDDDHDDDRDLLTTTDIITTYGRRIYEDALSHGRHHIDLNGRPCWLPDQWDAVLTDITLEDEKGPTP
jgi:hypothetical protein